VDWDHQRASPATVPACPGAGSASGAENQRPAILAELASSCQVSFAQADAVSAELTGPRPGHRQQQASARSGEARRSVGSWQRGDHGATCWRARNRRAPELVVRIEVIGRFMSRKMPAAGRAMQPGGGGPPGAASAERVSVLAAPRIPMYRRSASRRPELILDRFPLPQRRCGWRPMQHRLHRGGDERIPPGPLCPAASPAAAPRIGA